MKFKKFLALAALAAASISYQMAVAAESGHEHHGSKHNSESMTLTGEEDAYPLKTCVVSGEELGSMGDYHSYDHEGREVRFCCKMCKKDFLKDPGKYLAKLDEAAAKTAGDAASESGTAGKKTDGHGHDHHAH